MPNGQLPFDVLGIIFHHYVDHETIDHPLEILLLVSRSWNEAAIGHWTLWNHLNIYIGHEPASKVWVARLPLRLARCGPTIPLYIDIRNDVPYMMSRRNRQIYSDPSYCAKCYDANSTQACFTAASTGLEEALQLIKGSNGELSARWRHFQFDPNHGGDGFGLAKALSYNTPNLETLILRNVKPLPNAFAGINPLPDVKSLKAITVLNCELPFLPKLDDVLQATIGWEEGEADTIWETLQLIDAVKLQQLVLLLPLYRDAKLPPRLPDLTSLEIIGSNLPSNLYQCKTLRLSELKLSLNQSAGISHLFLRKKFHPETLRRVTITWNVKNSIFVFRDLRIVLRTFSHFDSISAQGQMLSVIVRVQSEATETSSALMRGKRLFNEDKGTAVGFEGDEDVGWFERLTSDWNLIPPSLPEPEFLARLSGPLGTIVLASSSEAAEGCN